MSKSTFIFCDICNSNCTLAVNEGFIYSRCMKEGGAYINGDDNIAKVKGWLLTSDGLYSCPKCQEKFFGIEHVLGITAVKKTNVNTFFGWLIKKMHDEILSLRWFSSRSK